MTLMGRAAAIQEKWHGMKFAVKEEGETGRRKLEWHDWKCKVDICAVMKKSIEI